MGCPPWPRARLPGPPVELSRRGASPFVARPVWQPGEAALSLRLRSSRRRRAELLGSVGAVDRFDVGRLARHREDVDRRLACRPQRVPVSGGQEDLLALADDRLAPAGAVRILPEHLDAALRDVEGFLLLREPVEI